MTKDYPDISEWLADNPEVAASIGHLMIAWGILEREIDIAIAELYRLHNDLDLAACITANLGTKAKLEIFQSCAHCLTDFLKPARIEDIDALINDTAKASSKYRNFVAHGRPTYLDLGGPDDMWLWSRESARKGGPKLHITHFQAAYFDKAVGEIKKIHSRWNQLHADLQKGLKLFDVYRLDER
jgi:hypothetical protein